MIRNVTRLFWAGLWQGFGFECSFFILWLGWHFMHRRVAHKLNENHFFHTIHEYFK